MESNYKYCMSEIRGLMARTDFISFRDKQHICSYMGIDGSKLLPTDIDAAIRGFSFALLQFRKLFLPLLLLNQNNIISIFSAGEMPIRKIDNCPAYGGFIRSGNSAKLIGRDVVLVERHLSAGLLSFNVVKIMLNQNNTISTKALKMAKESLGELIEGSATMTGILTALKTMASETGGPLDRQIMDECESLMTTMNRLLYEQESRLKHLQMMQITQEKACRYVDAARKRNTGKVTFNQAI